ncbi:DUF11 domain-containing protein [Nocardioides currus]|uniref:DUF11 domain-containing protein n=1 Tax=Nocardioides currus TaxID=2133958 RepID=A0A2R7YTS8_9ACTN|nr:DUF11 domain-containing protein [Nocardioides currus]PUA79781.1 hypothetical protein C7S10_17020 [Nocardioides currus]
MAPHARPTSVMSVLRAAAALLMVVMGLALVVIVPASPADAAVIRPFTEVYSAQTNGSLQVTGNTVMTCGTATNCAQTQSGAVAGSNNNFTMSFLDVDSDATTTRSSSANLTIPTGARVLYAGLFWGAARTAGTGGTAATGTVGNIKFRAPGAAGYTTLSAGQVDNQTSATNDYSAYRDVTSIVQGAGAGTYWGADIAAATGADRYAGWSLVVAIEDPSAPLRDLSVFSGYATVTGTEVVDTSISGFLAPPSGAVGAKFGTVTYEGDQGITGDYFQVNSSRLADAQSPSANFFGSRVTVGGANLTNRNPASLNNLGIDAKVVDAPGVIPNGATSASLRFASTGDFYYPAALTTQIDLYAPTIQGTKTATNLSGNSPAKTGDVLEYAMTFSNTGDDAAINSVITDVVPPNTTYVPGSMRITAGGNQGAKTDAAGDDQAEYDAASRTVRVRVGQTATASAGGRLAPANTTTVTFQTRVDSAAAGTTLSNSALLSYRAETIGRDYTYRTADVLTPVADEADVSITKTAAPEPVTAGNQITYTLTARNAGPTAASGVSVVDTLPTGATYVSSNPSTGTCAVNGQTLTCDLGTVASGAAPTITVVVRVPPDSDATSLTNVARVSATTSDPNPANNTASVSTTVNRQADLSLTKSVSPANPVPGTDVTYTLVATNNGASRAATVALTDTLPSSLAVRTATTNRGTCTITGNQVSCTAAGLDPGQTMQVVVTAGVPSNATTAALTNNARVGSATPDPNAANNAASATVTPAAPRADLVVTKQAVTSPIVAGRPVQYLVTVTNNGPSDAAAVTLADPVPGSISAISATPTAGTCSVAAGTVTCALGALASGRSVQVTVGGQLAPGATGDLVNAATVSSPTTDPTPGNNTGTSTAPITTSADLAITKTATPRPVIDGAVATYEIVVTNNGPSVARAVSVVDPVPAALTYLGSTSSQGTCTASGTPTQVTCAVGDLPVGASATVTVQARTPGDGSGTGATNTATVSSPTPDPVAGNNSATYVLPTGAQADLVMSKTATPNPVVAGQQVTFRLTARNNGPSQATGVRITDAVSARVTGVAVSSPGADCSATAGNNVSCLLPTLASGADFVVVVTGTVAPGSPTGPLVNDASVTSQTPTDPSPDNNTATATTDVVSSADVSVTKTGPATADAGTNGTWTLQVRNAGPSTATGVVLTDAFPEGVTFVSSTSTPAGTSCTAADRTVTCPIGAIAPGGLVTVTVTGAIASGVPAGTALRDVGGVSSTTPDPTPGNNSAAFTTNATESSDVRIAKSVTPDTMTPGAESVYSLRVTNAGPSDARTVVVTDTLDASLAIREATFEGGTCQVTGQQVTCTRPVLPNGADALVRIRVLVAAGRTAPVSNTGSVTSASDTTPGNNSSTITTPVAPRSDLQIIKLASDAQIAAGEGVTFTLTVVNNGPSAASAVTVADTLPGGLVPATATTPTGSCTVAAQQVDCALGTLQPGAAVTITVVAGSPPAAATGPRTNTATVASSTTDPTPDNNSSSATVTINDRADVSVTKTASSDSVVPGRQVVWTIVFSNAGPSTARNVTVTDRVPDGVTVVSAIHGTVTPCDIAGQLVTCNLGDRLPGQRVVTITGTVASGFAGNTIANTARTDSTTPDPTPGNNSSTVTSPISRLSDLEMIKTISPANPVAGQRVTYTLSVYNNGPSDALNPQLIDQLPSGLTDVVINRPTLQGVPATAECELRPPTDPGTADNPTAPTVFCSGPVFRANLPARVIGSVEATIAPGFTGTLTNTGRVSSDTIDVAAANNESVVSTVIGASADVSITKSVSPANPVPGQPVTWTVTARNAGPSVARNVVVRDDVNDAITGLTATTGATPNPCSVATGNDVTCSLGDLAPGAVVTMTISGGVPPGFTGALDNTATVSSPTDTTPGNNSATATSTTAPAADVSITKSVSPTAPVPGQPVSWTLTVRNTGPSVARNVVVRDDVVDPITGLTATTGATPNPCTVAAGNDVTCSLGDVAPGAVVTVTITGGVPPGFTGALNNTATVASPTDTTPGNNTATTTSNADPRADVSIVKTATPANPVPGRQVTYTLVVTNNGPSVARNVTLDDDANDALTGLTATTGSTPNPCTVAAGNVVACSLGDLAPGASVTVTVAAGVPAGYTGILSNTATIASPTDVTPGNNSSTASGATNPDANVSITKGLSPAAPVPGRDVTYTVVVTNSGPSVARNVTVADDVADVLTGVTATTGATPDPCTVSAGNDVACSLGDLPASGPGSTVVVTITGRLPADFTGDLTNTATVASPTDSTPGNNSATVTGTAAPAADVSITKSLTPATPVPGQAVTYTVTVTNNGPSVARDVLVRDDVDDALTGLTATVPCAVAAGNDVTCDLDDLDVGETVTLTLTGTLPAGFTGALDNTATVASPTDNTPGNNSATANGTAQARADVSITKSLSPTSPVPGAGVTWTVVVANAGPSTARNVVVRDDVVDAITGLTATTGATPNPCTVDPGNDVTCTLGDLAPGGSRTITLSGGLPAGFTGDLVNTATVSSPTDTTPGNNSATATGTAAPNANVGITKTVSPSNPVPGTDVTWTVVVGNTGPSTARNVVVRDDVNDAITGLTATTGATPDPCAVAAANDVTCTLGDLAPGATVVITLAGGVPADFTGQLSNTATVSSPTDTTPGNNSATANPTTLPGADLSIVKTSAPTVPVPGRDISYTVTVTNAGPSVARDVVIADDVDDALTDVTASAPCVVAAGNEVTCEVGDLGVGGVSASVTITITGRVPADFTGRLDNTATVASPTDNNPGNNSSTVTATADPQADVSITKTAAPANPVPGRDQSWTLSVTNVGPSVARQVLVTDDVDDALTGLSATTGTTPDPCAVAAGNAVTCDLGDLGVGETVTVTISGRVPPGFTGALSNTAAVASPTDVTPGNNTSTTNGTADPQADVSITKTATPIDPVPGQDASWTLVVSNGGPSVARNVVVRDDVLDAITDLSATAPCTIAAGNDVTCNLGDLPPGASRTITLTGGLPAGFTGAVDNTATVASPTDNTPGNNTSTTNGTADPQADVSITKTATPIDPVPGRNASWTVTVTNAGPSVARDVVVRDDVLDAITDLSATAPCTIAAGNDVTCNLGDLPPGASRTITLTGGLPAGFTGAVDNTATVASPTDVTPGNNTSTTNGTADPQADVSITKTATPIDPVPGRNASWTVTVTNAGPSVARDVEMTDDVLDDLTGVTATTGTTPNPCTVAADNVVTCDLGDLAPGSSRTITITGAVPADFTGAVDNTATVDSPTDNTPDDNESTTSGTADPQADVAITKTATPVNPVPGQDASWTITVTNAGPSVARQVVVTDDVIDAITGLTATAPCTIAAGNEVTCELGDLDPGDTVTLTLTGGLPDDYTGAVDNTAVVTSPTDVTPGNNSDTTNGTANARADVSITKTADPLDPVPGQDAAWELVVANDGPSVARQVVVTDDVIDALTGVTATTGTTPDPCTVAAGNVVTCELGSLAPGDSVTITISGRLPAGYTGAIDNTATVDSPTDTTPGNNESSTNGTADPQADVSITKTADPIDPVPGQDAAWRVVVTNDGPSVARQVVVTDDVIDALTGVTATTGTTPNPCTVAAGNVVTCELGALDPGDSVTVTVTGRLPAGYTGDIDNTATVTSPTDTTPGNNTATTNGTTSPGADVSITKTADPIDPVPGKAAGWTLTVTNAGPSTARDVVVTDDVIDALTGVTATTGATPNPCAVAAGNVITCELGSLAPGDTVRVTVAGAVPPGFTGAVSNTATVSSPTDSTPGNNTATTDGTAKPTADVSITKTLAPAEPVAGGPVTFTLTVANAGPSTARDVVVADSLIAALGDVSATMTAGGSCAVTGRDVSCRVDTLAPGATETITVRATVAPDFTGDVTNVATVTSSTPDPDQANNSASVTEALGSGSCANARGARVTVCPELEITKVASVAKADPGDKVDFEITVRNLGPSAARDVTVVDELPDELRLVGARIEDGQGRVATKGSTTTATIASLPPGAATTITVVTRLAPDADGAVRNVATASTDLPGGQVESESAGDVVRVTQPDQQDDDGSDGPDKPAPGPGTDDDDDGVLPDTGLGAGLLPLGALSALLVAGGLLLIRRSTRRPARRE